MSHEKIEKIEAQLAAAEARAEDARLRRQESALHAVDEGKAGFDGEVIVDHREYDEATRTLQAIEQEIEALRVALLGAQAEQARVEAEEQAEQKRER